MADYVGIAETMPPADLPVFMSEYYETQGQAIDTNGGTVSLHIGDNILSVWDQPDSAQLACESAIAQCGALKKFGEWAKARGYPTPALRIGINTGVMNIQRGPEKGDVGVLGDAVNFAARLDQLNKEYGTRILMSAATREGLSNSLTVRPVDVVRVKGQEHGIGIFELIGRTVEIESEQRKFLATFNAGFTCYKAVDFANALSTFERAQEQNPTDILTGIFVSRCHALMKMPTEELSAQHER